MPRAAEQRREQHLGLLPGTERGECALQRVRLNLQKVQLLFEPPSRRVADRGKHRLGGEAVVLHGKGKIVKRNACADCAATVQLAHQQL
ncbi:hypothetical protein SDC9_164004 [bioreactor metagenome]|uniref:Uncharacterized protein n=1 Tax=bioreactor metagenome TaxID=1076179 RepID=A0A645FT85_9ZZZZ